MQAGNQRPRALGELRPGPWWNACNGTGPTLSRRICRKVNHPASTAADLKRDTEVGWTALYGQFGAGFKRPRAFRTRFLERLEIVLVDHPEARVSPNGTGVTLCPSRPVVAKFWTPPASKP